MTEAELDKQAFALADRNARLAKPLYNAALFRIRQAFTGWDKTDRTDNEKEVFRELDLLKKTYPKLGVGRVLSYRALEKLMRVTGNPDFFSGLPMQTAQAGHTERIRQGSLEGRGCPVIAKAKRRPSRSPTRMLCCTLCTGMRMGCVPMPAWS